MISPKIWIQAARPKTLPFGLAPVCVGSALSYHEGFFSWMTFFLCFFSALFLQIGANYANDVYDYENGADRQNRIGPVRAVASGALTTRAMKIGMVTVFSLAFLFASPLIWREGAILALVFLCVVMIAISYSKGPSYPRKMKNWFFHRRHPHISAPLHRPCLQQGAASRSADAWKKSVAPPSKIPNSSFYVGMPLAYLGLGELTNLIFMAALPTQIMYYMQTHQFSFAPFWLGICLGGMTSAVLCMNNLRDEISDKVAYKGTLVVRFGQKFGKTLFAILTLYPLILPWLLVYFYCLPLGVGGVFLLIFPALHLVRATFSSTKPQEFLAIFSKVALLALVYIIALSYGLLV